MKPPFQDLYLSQLSRRLRPFHAARCVRRPPEGWIKAMRVALGITLQNLGDQMRTRRQVVAALEKSETSDRITLRSLRRAAEVMGLEVIYALVPKRGTLKLLAEERRQKQMNGHVLAVEHTMALEDQAVKRVGQRTRGLAKRKRSR